jgi:hypothetical protein
MKPARLASSLIMAGLVAACSDHPIQTGRSVYLSPREPVRTLVETPPAAYVPVPPTPVLRPGSIAGLEQLRAGGDADAELFAGDAPATQPADPAIAGSSTGATTTADTANGATNTTTGAGAAAAAQPGAAQPGSGQPGLAQPPASDSITVASSDDDPDHLVGLSETDALRLLGKPKAKADTPPSRVWTYSSTSCDLRLFFYPEIGSTSYRTLTYEIDDRDPTDSSRRSCVGGLLKNHAS